MKIQPTTGMVGSSQAFSREAKRNKNGLNINFNGNVPKLSPMTDKFLKNKFVKGLFEFADKNPFAFNVVALAVACMGLRTSTVLIMPGSNDKDKKYAAGKSFISSFISTVSRLMLILPVGIAIEKLGKAAKENPKLEFPADGTTRFKAFKFGVNNGIGLLLSVPTAALVIYLVAKIMDKIMHHSKNGKKSDNAQEVKTHEN